MLGIRRLLAFAVDWLVFSLWAVAVLGVVVWSQVPWVESAWASQAVGACVTTIPFALYCAVCESSAWRATLGKRALGLTVRVASRETAGNGGVAEAGAGGRLGVGRALVRAVGKFVPWELGHTAAHQFTVAGLRDESPALWVPVVSGAAMLLALGYVATLFVGDGRAPYDRMVGTVVVAARPPGEENRAAGR